VAPFCKFLPVPLWFLLLMLDRYVAMHAMQEDGGAHTHDHGLNGYADASTSTQRKPKGPQMRDTLATVGGMVIPLLTQFGHHH
jgi:zinc transporter 9